MKISRASVRRKIQKIHRYFVVDCIEINVFEKKMSIHVINQTGLMLQKSCTCLGGNINSKWYLIFW